MKTIFKMAFVGVAMLPFANCQIMDFDEPGVVEKLKSEALVATPPIEIVEMEYTAKETLTGSNYRLENVKVTKGASLTINADGYVQIDGNFNAELGSSLTIE